MECVNGTHTRMESSDNDFRHLYYDRKVYLLYKGSDRDRLKIDQEMLSVTYECEN